MKSVLIELHFLPSIEYFCTLLNFEKVVLEKHEHYVKQSYRNRCYIQTAHGVDTLIVPLTGKHGKVIVKDVRIDYSSKWQNNIWRTLESAYRKAPFFEYYETELHSILYKRFEFLFDLNRELLSFCLKNLAWDLSISESPAYEKVPESAITDLRGAIAPKIPYYQRGWYRPHPYYQVFGNTFAANLSLVDLLFSAGPEAKGQLLRSAAMLNK